MTFLSGRTKRHGEFERARWVGIMETSHNGPLRQIERIREVDSYGSCARLADRTPTTSDWTSARRQEEGAQR